jgi:hypothetical protein
LLSEKMLGCISPHDKKIDVLSVMI